MEEPENIKAIIVKFKNKDIGKLQREKFHYLSPKISEENGVPLFKASLEYQVPYKNSTNKHGIRAKVTQFPIRLAWASTAHKLQGITLHEDLLCHGKSMTNTICDGMAYVMLSRCSNLENVFLAEDFKLKHIHCSRTALKEKNNLDARNIVPSIRDKRFDLTYVNCMNLLNNILDIESDIECMNSDLICLSETWMDPKNPIEMDGKVLNHASFGNGKGVCTFSPPNYNLELQIIKAEEKYQFMSLMLKDYDLQLILVYISKGCNFSNLAHEISQIIDSRLELMILGDFNYDKSESNALTKLFFRLNLKQLISNPTHIKGRTIDHVYISKTSKNEPKISLQYKYFTDHCSLSIQLV